jgi:hypothetical protein
VRPPFAYRIDRRDDMDVEMGIDTTDNRARNFYDGHLPSLLSFEWSRGGTHVPGRRPWTSGLLLTARSITLPNGACLVVLAPSNKHRRGAGNVATTPTTAVDPHSLAHTHRHWAICVRGAATADGDGDWFAVPLRAGGFAVGMVARDDGRVGVIGYDFNARWVEIATVADVAARVPYEAIRVIRFGDLGFIKWLRRWPPAIGSCPRRPVDSPGGHPPSNVGVVQPGGIGAASTAGVSGTRAGYRRNRRQPSGVGGACG